MSQWALKDSDLKRYPHFDSPLSAVDAEALALNPDRVRTHSFYPFLRYEERWNRFASKGSTGKTKKRPIRYAARADAYIFSRYRHILAEKYEEALYRDGLSDCVIAYRRILCDDESRGKCNIHFAKDAIDAIRKLGDCCCITLDISSFFESLDHLCLKRAWERVLGVNQLASDHFAVFRAITQYSYVEKLAVYERLGHYGVKRHSSGGLPLQGYLTPFRKLPTQLCRGVEFRQKIAGGDGRKSLIKKNLKPYGIPQGAPISDLLANLYLFEFDKEIAARCADMGGYYMRYSDDILLILPVGLPEAKATEAEVRLCIRKYGSKLLIKEEKSSIYEVQRIGGRQRVWLRAGSQGANGFEYLGFRYDGEKVFLRDSTLSNLYRKVTRSAKAAVRRFIDERGLQDPATVMEEFNYDAFISRFGRVEKFETFSGDTKRWTFWTYARRAKEIFGPLGTAIQHQLRDHREHIRSRVNRAIVAAFS
jgi:hypothetical protein